MKEQSTSVKFVTCCQALAKSYGLTVNVNFRTKEINFIGDIDENKAQCLLGEISVLAEQLEGICLDAIDATVRSQ